MKRLQALIAATIITGLVAVGMLLIGVNAVFNTQSVPVSNTRVDASLTSATGSSATVAQLQNEIAQYQSREQQYQQQLSEASQQVQQLEQVLTALQQRGLIRIGSDGQIQIRRGEFDGETH